MVCRDDWNGAGCLGEVAVLRIKWRLDLYISDIFVLIEQGLILSFNSLMELNFDDIVSGKEVKPAPSTNKTQNKSSDVKARQQSCMISDIDKDLLPSNTKAPIQNFRVSLADMLSLDKQDESLEKYKESLLGKINEQHLKEDEPAEVQIVKVELVCQGRGKGNIHLEFRKHDPKEVRRFTIKQGSIWCMRIHFVVRNDIVFGLKFVNNVYKLMAKVDKDEDKMGSFAPQQKQHVFDLPWVQAPSGFLARGDYKGKGLFLDNDGIVHCQFDYVMTIGSDW